MKQVLFVLALWFLISWAYTDKLKPFIMTEFGFSPGKTGDDSVTKKDTMQYHPVRNASSFIYGIDISHYEHNEADSLGEIIKSNDSLVFVICKATQGIHKRDTSFLRNWGLVRNNKLIRGAYHFFICAQDAKIQADTFIRVVGELLPNDLPPIIDFETAATLNTKCGDVKNNVLLFLKRLEQHYRRKPIIYVNKNDANYYLEDPLFGGYPLWIAKPSRYPDLTDNDIPVAWKGNWHFWQRSWDYKIDNINNDLDKFNGDSIALVKFIAGSIIK